MSPILVSTTPFSRSAPSHAVFLLIRITAATTTAAARCGNHPEEPVSAAHHYAQIDRVRAQLHGPGPHRYGPPADGPEHAGYPPVAAAAGDAAGDVTGDVIRVSCEEAYQIGAAAAAASAACSFVLLHGHRCVTWH
jgi:hypothetical protein